MVWICRCGKVVLFDWPTVGKRPAPAVSCVICGTRVDHGMWEEHRKAQEQKAAEKAGATPT